MKRKMVKLIGLAFVIGFLGISNVNAATNFAKSCSQADVQAAINSASAGDTVIVPAGECTWTSGITFNKTVKLEGAGKDSTIITGTGSNLFTWSSYSVDKAPWVGKFGLVITNLTGAAFVITYSKGWRIHENRVVSVGVLKKLIFTTSWGGETKPLEGLIDQNEFENIEIGWFGVHINPYPPGKHRWAEPLGLGSERAIYIEDNVFTGTVSNSHHQLADTGNGGRYVVRYNKSETQYFEFHSAQHGGQRAGMMFEIYRNEMGMKAGQTHYMPWRMRGGTGMIWGNILTGAWNNKYVALDNVRSYGSNINSGGCFGYHPWDGNEAYVGGTHTGGNNAATLVDSTKKWSSNELLRVVRTGKHNGGNSNTTLTPLVAHGFGTNGPVNGLLYNISDGSSCMVTSFTSGTMTCSGGLQGGSDNLWTNNDDYRLTFGAWIWNITDGSKCPIVYHIANTVTCTLTGGTNNKWNNGDKYKVTFGWPCRDQIGQSTDAWLWTDGKPYPPQDRSSLHLWSNRYGANIVPATVINDSSYHIKNNRDYYDEAASFDGKSGTGVGTLANRPATCTTGVGYWATDQGNWNKKPGGQQGVLYKCTSPNTWTLYYTPYTYPHPLRQAWIGQPPQNPRIIY